MTTESKPAWITISNTLRALAVERAKQDLVIGEWLLHAERDGGWRAEGFRSLSEFAERVLGMNPQVAIERLRVAKKLEVLPETAARMAAGAMHYSIARELTRVATPETERDWLAWSMHRTARQVEEKVAKHEPDERPSDPGDARRVRKRMVFELTAAQFATVRARIDRIRQGDSSLTDAEILCMLALGVENTPAEEGQPAFRLEVQLDNDGSCHVAGANDERSEVAPETAECAACDAEVYTWSLINGMRVKKRTTIPAAVARAAMRRAGGRCECCGARLALNKHHLRLVSEGGTHDLSNIVVLCSAHHARFHDGMLLIEGSRESGLRFVHADGTPYGGVVSPEEVARYVEAHRRLLELGFEEGEVRAALDRSEERLHEPSVDWLVTYSSSWIRKVRTERAAPPPGPPRGGEARA